MIDITNKRTVKELRNKFCDSYIVRKIKYVLVLRLKSLLKLISILSRLNIKKLVNK